MKLIHKIKKTLNDAIFWAELFLGFYLLSVVVLFGAALYLAYLILSGKCF